MIVAQTHDIRIANLDCISARQHDIVNDMIAIDEQAVGALAVERVDQIGIGIATPSLVPSCSSTSRTRLSTRDLAL